MSRSWSRRPQRRYAAARPRGLVRRLFDYALTFVLLGLLILLATRLDRVETRKVQSATAIINDGDSLTLGAERIRLRGIDAPEYNQTCQRNGADYPCGRQARQALARLVAGKAVSSCGSQRDRYGRTLGDCTAGGVDLNRAQVEAGWAVAYGDFEGLEGTARAAKLGIWAGDFVSPQEWRATHGEFVERKHDTLGSLGDGLREMFRF